MSTRPQKEMQAFAILWFGQMVSLLGSAMTWFAFTLWVWEKTGRATALAIVSLFVFLPSILFGPFAGTFVDRWNRKLTLIISDLASAIATAIVLILYVNQSLQLWHIYLLGLLTGIFTAFQYPAYITVSTLMLPKEHYARAEGMMGLSQALTGILAPVTAAALLSRIGMEWIMLLDLTTFLFAFATIIWIHVPPPAPPKPDSTTQSGFVQETLFGFRYIRSRSSLRALIVLFVAANFFLAIGATLISPLILSQTQNNKDALAMVQSSGALGGIIGGAILSVSGGLKKRVSGILLGGVSACLLGITGLGVGRSVLVWAVASFFFSFFEPFVEGGNLAIWQTKVDVNAQGRVLSAQRLMVQIPYMFGTAASGWLADQRVISIRSLNNISAVLIVAGLCGGAVFLLGFASPAIRNAETLLPDQNVHLAKG